MEKTLTGEGRVKNLTIAKLACRVSQREGPFVFGFTLLCSHPLLFLLPPPPPPRPPPRPRPTPASPSSPIPPSLRPPQVSECYSQAIRALESEPCSVITKKNKDWLKLLKIKVVYFQALAHVSQFTRGKHLSHFVTLKHNLHFCVFGGLLK